MECSYLLVENQGWYETEDYRWIAWQAQSRWEGEKAKPDLVMAKSDLAKEKSVAESALAKAESALAKANLEIVSLKTKPGRSPADAQLPHGYTYWCIIGGANAIYLLEEDDDTDTDLNPVCWSPFTTREYIFTSAAHSFAPSKTVEEYVDLQEGMTELYTICCWNLGGNIAYHHLGHREI